MRERFVLDMKARSAHYLSVLSIVRHWCHREDSVTVVCVMGKISLATKDRERWLLGPQMVETLRRMRIQHEKDKDINSKLLLNCTHAHVCFTAWWPQRAGGPHPVFF